MSNCSNGTNENVNHSERILEVHSVQPTVDSKLSCQKKEW